MTTKPYSNILIDRSVPDFVREDYPMVETFLKAYYDWMSQTKNPLDISTNLIDYRLSDTTLQEFEDYFFNEYLHGFPKEVLADKTLLIKFIKTFYREKGNEASYKFLFRLLYNEQIEFYYPKNDVLRASDGKWYIQRVVKIPYTSNINISEIVDKKIEGVTSHATAIITSAIRYTERGRDIIELSIENIYGSFLDNEGVKIWYSTDFYAATLYDVYSGVEIDTAGSGYKVGDVFTLQDGSNIVGIGRVKKTSKGPVSNFTIVQKGINYNGNYKQINYFYGLPVNSTLDTYYLPTMPVKSSTIDYSILPVNYAISPLLFPTTNPDVVIIEDSENSFGFGATAVINIVDQDGGIVEITLMTGGNEYELPQATIDSATGSGATIEVIGGGGSIRKVIIDSFPIKLSTDNSSTIIPNFDNIGDGTATGHMTSSAIGTSEGRYLNTDGHLSSNKRLQDNYYYQDYSYVLKTRTSIEKWKNTILDIIHPAGTAVFGDVYILTSTTALNSHINTYEIEILDENILSSLSTQIHTLSVTIGTI